MAVYLIGIVEGEREVTWSKDGWGGFVVGNFGLSAGAQLQGGSLDFTDVTSRLILESLSPYPIPPCVSPPRTAVALSHER